MEGEEGANLTIPEPSPPKEVPSERPTTKTLLDREERAVAALLTRYKNLVSLAAMPPGDDAVKETAAAHAYQMEVESKALVRPTSQSLRALLTRPGPSRRGPPAADARAEGAVARGSAAGRRRG